MASRTPGTIGYQHVLNLRKKVEPVPAAPRYLTSVRGMGYRFDG
jgi:DNA-binding response OmpR family regulator